MMVLVMLQQQLYVLLFDPLTIGRSYPLRIDLLPHYTPATTQPHNVRQQYVKQTMVTFPSLLLEAGQFSFQ
jgi:hypothetical protein